MSVYRIPTGESFGIPNSLDCSRELALRALTRDPVQASSSLLNKRDIIRYVSATGMVYPFFPENLKSASYEVNVGTEAVYWDDAGVKVELKGLSKENKIPLFKNSITFVDVNIHFFLPFYIAVRFNLSITHVHRGLLLGTGPLVDPGFWGKIMIPLHNLTSNDYYITPGEPLIAVEFTRITEDPRLDTAEGKGWYGKNIKEKNFDFHKYFKDALPLGVGRVESSLSRTLADLRNKIKYFERLKRIALWSLAGAIFTFLALIITTINLVSDANKYVSDVSILVKNQDNSEFKLAEFVTRSDLNGLKKEMNHLLDQLRNNETAWSVSNIQAQSNKTKITRIQNELESIQERIYELKEEINKNETN